ncbi:NifU family protein [Hymenobacter aerilatus]|uniref:NifU family protein n=1 Tax=Hymenobacter aerilatus TaxID=2932251 RepID=A0A8T9STJ9_9BACT|nr:NifU family protein [Hymenobacter aerilatus]UOR05482.1 NifU family protein [Hymenobacter aerilatus]
MNTSPAASPVSIYAEASPNPESMKFVLNATLLSDGVSVDYPNVEAAANSPLAQELFNFDYVGRVFIAANFVTITKTTEHQWTQLIPELRTFLKSYVEANGPIFTVDPAEEQRAAQQAAATGDHSEQDQQTSQKIIDLLDNYVRPAVEQDGGNITFKSYNNGVVTVNLQGSCSGCPSATVTLKSGIENLLKRMVPEVTEVVAEGVTV